MLQRHLNLRIIQHGSPYSLRYDDSTQQVAVLHNSYLLYILVVLFQFIFYLAGLYILAVGEHNNLLGTSGNGNTSFLVDSRQVTRMDKTILIYHLSCLLGSVVIAQHHIGTLGTQLAIHQFAFNTRQGKSHAARSDIRWTGKADDRSSLRHAIAFQHIQS